ncbi:MAG: PKD domain-containing protein [Euryarchaeota archaeon]|nr:PKD domain-containing protein [Euryarchaeota archaeon]
MITSHDFFGEMPDTEYTPNDSGYSTSSTVNGIQLIQQLNKTFISKNSPLLLKISIMNMNTYSVYLPRVAPGLDALNFILSHKNSTLWSGPGHIWDSSESLISLNYLDCRTYYINMSICNGTLTMDLRPAAKNVTVSLFDDYYMRTRYSLSLNNCIKHDGTDINIDNCLENNTILTPPLKFWVLNEGICRNDNKPPIAIMKITPQTGDVETEFVMKSLSYDLDGSIISTQWELNQNIFLSGGVVEHSFTRKGDNYIRLTVIDNNFDYNISVARIVINNRAPTINVKYQTTVNVNTNIVFDASESRDIDGKIIETHWYIDGQVLNGSKIEHRFLKIGIYLIRLIVEDNDGAVREQQFKIYIIDDKTTIIQEKPYYSLSVVIIAFILSYVLTKKKTNSE